MFDLLLLKGFVPGLLRDIAKLVEPPNQSYRFPRGIGVYTLQLLAGCMGVVAETISDCLVHLFLLSPLENRQMGM